MGRKPSAKGRIVGAHHHGYWFRSGRAYHIDFPSAMRAINWAVDRGTIPANPRRGY